MVQPETLNPKPYRPKTLEGAESAWYRAAAVAANPGALADIWFTLEMTSRQVLGFYGLGGLGFRVWGLGFRVWGLGFRV